jgi:hypothetical protein
MAEAQNFESLPYKTLGDYFTKEQNIHHQGPKVSKEHKVDPFRNFLFILFCDLGALVVNHFYSGSARYAWIKRNIINGL